MINLTEINDNNTCLIQCQCLVGVVHGERVSYNVQFLIQDLQIKILEFKVSRLRRLQNWELCSSSSVETPYGSDISRNKFESDVWSVWAVRWEDGARSGCGGAQRLGAYLLRGGLRHPRLPDPQHRGAGHRPGPRALRTSHGLAPGE